MTHVGLNNQPSASVGGLYGGTTAASVNNWLPASSPMGAPSMPIGGMLTNFISGTFFETTICIKT